MIKEVEWGWSTDFLEGLGTINSKASHITWLIFAWKILQMHKYNKHS